MQSSTMIYGRILTLLKMEDIIETMHKDIEAKLQ